MLMTTLWIWTSGEIEPLDLAWLSELAQQLGLAGLLKSIVSALSYLIIISKLIVDADGGEWYLDEYLSEYGVKRKHLKCLAYFISVFTINILFVIGGREVFANYIILALSTIFILDFGAYNIADNKTNGYITGFSFALTILVAFQWAIAFVGSIGFIMFPHDGITDMPVFIAVLSTAYLGSALLLRRYCPLIFRFDMSRKLLIIDIGAKLFFIAFFNLFFPMYFDVLGMESYSVLDLVLLTIAVIFAIYREYSVSLEKQLAVHNRDQLAIAQWAQQTITKFERSSEKRLRYYGCIDRIENPTLQALLYDLIYTSEELGIYLDVSVSPSSLPGYSGNHINLDNYDLYSIIVAFIDNALSEAKTQDEKSIHVKIEGNKGFRFMLKTNIGQAHSEIVSPEFRLNKDAIVKEMRKNPNITISFSKTDSFIQVLEIE